jgi:hypothetical protein
MVNIARAKVSRVYQYSRERLSGSISIGGVVQLLYISMGHLLKLISSHGCVDNQEDILVVLCKII